MGDRRRAVASYLVETAWLYCLSLVTIWLVFLATHPWWGSPWTQVEGEPMPLPTVTLAQLPWGQWLAVAFGMALVPLAWELLLRRATLLEITGRVGTRATGDILWAVMGTAGLLALLAAGLAVTGSRLPAALTSRNALFLSVHWLLNATGEEVLYRGIIQRRLCRMAGGFWGILPAAALHAFAGHPGAPFVENLWLRFPAAAVFGCLYYWRKTLVAPIAAHWLANMSVSVGFPLRG